MIDFVTNGAATSAALSYGWAGEAAVARRTVPPTLKVEGTALPIAGRTTGVFMGADQAQRAEAARVRAVVDQGIPPRRGPVRC